MFKSLTPYRPAIRVLYEFKSNLNNVLNKLNQNCSFFSWRNESFVPAW